MELEIFQGMRRVYGIILLPFATSASWNFPRQDHNIKESRGFPGMELGILRVAKSSAQVRAEKALITAMIAADKRTAAGL